MSELLQHRFYKSYYNENSIGGKLLFIGISKWETINCANQTTSIVYKNYVELTEIIQ